MGRERHVLWIFNEAMKGDGCIPRSARSAVQVHLIWSDLSFNHGASTKATSPPAPIQFMQRQRQQQQQRSARLSRASILHSLSCYCTPISIKSSSYLQPYLRVTSGPVNTDSFINAGDDTWNASHPTVEHFWSIVHDMTYEDKQKLLLFVTGEGCSVPECVLFGP